MTLRPSRHRTRMVWEVPGRAVSHVIVLVFSRRSSGTRLHRILVARSDWCSGARTCTSEAPAVLSARLLVLITRLNQWARSVSSPAQPRYITVVLNNGPWIIEQSENPFPTFEHLCCHSEWQEGSLVRLFSALYSVRQ